MGPRTALLDVVLSERPGTHVEAFTVGKSLVVGLQCRAKKVWIALDRSPESPRVEDALRHVANTLVCCQHCANGRHLLCHQEHRVIASRLRRFLGETGFQRFLASAPVAAGN